MPYWRCLEFGITQLRNIHYIFGLGICLPMRFICYNIIFTNRCNVTGFTLLSFICYLMIQIVSLVMQGEEGLLSAYSVMDMDTSAITVLKMVMELIQRCFFFLSIILILKNCHIGFYFFLEPLYMYWYFWFVILAFSQLC